MPLIVNNQVINTASIATIKSPTAATTTAANTAAPTATVAALAPTPTTDMTTPPEVLAKREARDANRTKYTVVHKKARTPEEYKGIKLVIDGQEVPVSDSAKFMLEQMVEIPEAEEANTADAANTTGD